MVLLSFKLTKSKSFKSARATLLEASSIVGSIPSFPPLNTGRETFFWRHTKGANPPALYPCQHVSASSIFGACPGRVQRRPSPPFPIALNCGSWSFGPFRTTGIKPPLAPDQYRTSPASRQTGLASWQWEQKSHRKTPAIAARFFSSEKKGTVR